ncbi:hypothetical protein [Pseudomonas japonica]|uniref:hypothetical protein n=1 Tax=Pseudomonas japonica TaxID=256466 RepID=UPI0015E459B6|nr:hypothetical protein [Pseudomonas japonica]MBA1245466.1 hypothetical protein [Pseudomonas japonica]
MDAQPSNSLPAPNQDAFSLGIPSMLAAWKHHCTLLNHELDETCRELANGRRRIAQLVTQHDNDQQRLKHQQARIGELETEVKRLKDRLVTAMAREAAGHSAAIYENAYHGTPPAARLPSHP